MCTKETIISELKKNPVKNLNMINFVENSDINFTKKVGNSILVKGKSDESWTYISSSSREEFEKLIEECDNGEHFAVVESWMVPFICKNRKTEWQMSCTKLYFPEDRTLSENDHFVTELSVDEAEYIYEHSKYKNYLTVEYVRERLKKGIALGIYEDGLLAAWIMTHDDGALGFFNVRKEHRRKGYGYSLLTEIIKRQRQQGKISFIHIEEDNVRSMNLARKIGFIRDRRVHWIKTKNKSSLN